MDFTVLPPVLTDIAQTEHFFGCVAACESVADISTFSTGNVSFDTLKSGSSNSILEAIDNLDHAIGDWQHALSTQINSTVSKLFNQSSAQARLLNADIQKYRKIAQDANKNLKQPGLTEDVRRNLMTEEQDALDHLERAKSMAKELQTKLYIPLDIYQAVNESNALAKEGINLLLARYKLYSDTIDIKTTPTNLRFGIMKDIEYTKEMDKHRDALSDVYSETYKRLEEIKDQTDRICSSRVFGSHPDVSMEHAMLYDLKRVSTITQTYDQFKQISKKILLRLRVLRSEMRLIAGGEESKYKYTPQMIMQEIAFLSVFCLKYSGMLNIFLRPQLGVIDTAALMTI